VYEYNVRYTRRLSSAQISTLVRYAPLMNQQSAPRLFAVCFLLLLRLPICASSHSNKQSDTPALEQQKPIDRELKPGQSHSYQVTVSADQFLSVVIEQRGIDITTRLLSPDGKTLSEVNNAKGLQGTESLIAIADVAGPFKVEVSPSEKNSATGNYEIKLIALRLPTDDERSLVKAQRLMEEASSLRRKGKYDDARLLAEQALSIREKVLGPDHIEVARSLNLIAIIYDDQNDYAKAEPLNVRALSIREKTLGPDHPDVARSLFNLAWIYKVRQEFAKAESTYLRVLAIQEKALGPNHSEVATTLNDLAVLYNQTGKTDQSIAVNKRVLAIREEALGPDDVGVAKALNNLARVYERKGDYEQAETCLKRAVSIWEKALGPDHPEVAFGLDGLGKIYALKGDYASAEPLFQRALAIRETALGPNHPEVGTSLNNLAVLYRQKGDYLLAESLLKRDLEITEKRLGPEHPFLGPTLNNLAGIYVITGDFAKAEPLYKRALYIYEKALGANHQDVGWTLTLLGQLYAADRKQSDNQQAEAMFLRSLAELEKALGPEHPRIATPLNGLGQLAARRKDYSKAESLHQRALAIQEKALGPDHPDVAQSLYELSILAGEQGHTALALSFLTRSLAVRERHLSHNLPLGSERQKLEYLRLFENDTNHALALHSQLAPNNSQALQLAFSTLLLRKGRALDVMSDNIASLRHRAAPGDVQLFNQLSDVRSQLATLTLRGPGAGNPNDYRVQVSRLEERLDRLEADVSKRSADFRLQSQPVTLESVQSMIPVGTALIEFARYRSADSTTRYAAYVLGHEGAPKFVDLGPGSEIENTVNAWRAALRDPTRTDVRRLARIVDRKVMQAVRPHLGTALRLLISPDGPLNLIPFAALVDEQQKFLAERYSITYLTSGRDLLRLRSTGVNRESVVIVADPEFGAPALVVPAKSETSRTNGSAQVDYSQVFFGPLPGVSYEVRTLKELLPGATLLVKEQATEAAVKKLHSPRILHIATHGFFLEDTKSQAIALPLNDRMRLGKWTAAVENPLLRSGLALAGANQGRSGDDDGVLTALEAGGLDLFGTKLVVLSACDTGVGEVKSGDGVYGLRRSLVLAGSESQMISLWAVSDRSTRDLMIGYYRRITQGQGRGESLRQVQLQLLRSKAHSHPYYWASFIQSGEWANIEGVR
jgi:CHAT domain-containing protein/tetratricopeptide (TPR) repeat protein